MKEQGSCGSCWAFASVSTIESISAIDTGALYSLSEEQVGVPACVCAVRAVLAVRARLTLQVKEAQGQPSYAC